MELKNKVIVITGAATGLGYAIAKSLIAEQAKIAIVDLNLEAAETAAALVIGSKGYAADVGIPNQVNDVFKRIKEDFGRIDALVNNAGILMDGMMISAKEQSKKKLSVDKFKSVLDVNLTGSFLCAQAAAEHMIDQQRGGVIINISSISRAGNIGQSNYSASKAGVVALTTTWSKELAQYGIRTGAIAPGFIETDMTGSIPEHILSKIISKIPVRRMGSPKEIALGIKFILENEYFNGRVLEIDGGMRI